MKYAIKAIIVDYGTAKLGVFYFYPIAFALTVILLNICSGGNIINVTGSNFDYIQRPQLILYIDSNVNVTVVSILSFNDNCISGYCAE